MLTNEFNELLNQFDTELSYNSAQIKVKGCSINLYKKESSSNVVMFCAIARVDANNQHEALEFVAKANFLGRKTDGACVGYLEDNEVIVLKKTLNITVLTKDNLLSEFNSFANIHKSLISEYISYSKDQNIAGDTNSVDTSAIYQSMIL